MIFLYRKHAGYSGRNVLLTDDQKVKSCRWTFITSSSFFLIPFEYLPCARQRGSQLVWCGHVSWDRWPQRGQVSQRKWYRDLSNGNSGWKVLRDVRKRKINGYVNLEKIGSLGGSKLKGKFSCWKWWVKLLKDCFLRTTNLHQAKKRKQEATED